MLQIIISPAKQMSINAEAFAPRGIPPFPVKTRQLLVALRALEREQGATGLKELWRVNDKLLAENIERLHAIEPVMSDIELEDPLVARSVGPAVFSYVGIQYRSMAPDVLDLDALEWLQRHLWVLSGFYGCARPFDAVTPYRLEMGARLAVGDARNLYEFWDANLAKAIEDAAQEAEDRLECDAAGEEGELTIRETVCVINLASLEYAKAVLPHLDAQTQTITCLFGEELRNGKPVQRATASKIARGSMVRWMAEHGVEDPHELERFDVGYALAPELSMLDRSARNRTLVFMKR